VSCEDSGTPYWLEGAGLLALVCPAWKVDLAGTWRWKAAGPLVAGPGDTADIFRLEFRESPSKAFVLSVEEHFSWGSIADRLLAAAATATPRPVALDMVLDLVMPRALGEVGVLESEAELEALEDELEVRPPVLGRDGVVADMRDSLLALMVAESTVFCRLKLEVVV